MAAAISRMRSLPSGWRMIQAAVKPPYSRAITPQTSAMQIALFNICFSQVFVCAGTALSSRLEVAACLLAHGHVLQPYVLRQAVLERRERLARDERLQII